MTSPRIFAIGDIHGCAAELEELLGMLPADDETPIVFLGDYVDRGPASHRVIQMILELSRRRPVIPLAGNHEMMFREFLDRVSEQHVARFIFNGGSTTLAGYGNDEGSYSIPADHLEFIQNLRLFHEHGDYFFVHAGVPDRPLASLDPEADRDHFVWSRKGFINSNYRWEKRIVHGHTPVRAVEIGPTRINLDTGCVFGGFLSAIELPSHRVLRVARRGPVLARYLRDQRSRRAAVRFLGSVPVTLTRASGTLAFETVDYSEIGMYLRPVDPISRDLLHFKAGDAIVGTIGDREGFRIPFTGRVARTTLEPSGWHYGVMIDSGPMSHGPHDDESDEISE